MRPRKQPPTKAEARALNWLIENQGHARPDRWGRMIAVSGEMSRQPPITFLRLVLAGWCARSVLDGYVGVTQDGFKVACSDSRRTA